MIEYIRGELTELSPTRAVVECLGVGYGLNISLGTYSAIQGKKEVKLLVIEVIREDAYTLWGFATKGERDLFVLLTSVSGIGAAIARMVLSALPATELVNAISEGNERLLKSIKGIGPKAAQRIIVELKDKVTGMSVGPATLTGGTGIDQEVREEAVSALTMLGFPPAPSQKVVVKLLHSEPSMPVEEVIKKALKLL